MSSRDYHSYLAALLETSEHYSVAIHSYALMTNHVHLLVTPCESMAASRMMQQLGRKYVSYFNKACGRTGTLWEGRFRSSMINSPRYLFACYRYIEMNPVRAGMVDRPDEYPWSSYRTNALGLHSDLITPHDEVLMLAQDSTERLRRYRRLFKHGNGNLEDEIRSACQKGVTLE